jgi:hypothetical protein
LTFGLDEVGSIGGLEKDPFWTFPNRPECDCYETRKRAVFVAIQKSKIKNDSVVVQVVVVVVGHFPST